MIDIETPQEIEVVSNGIDVEARSLDVEVVDLKELDVTVAKKEFVITGDDIYVPKLYDDAPQWMKDLVQIVVNSAVETNNMALISEINSTLSQFATSYVPLNQYTQSILDLSNEDVRINTVIETLNSNYNDGISNTNAQILNLENTKASKDEVVAQIVTTLSAQLANPTSDLGATIGRIDQTIVNNQEANALSMEVLTASLEGVSGDVVSNAEIVNNALAYVGIDEAGASIGTGLSAYLEGNDGNFGSAGSQINNDIKVTAESVESKWAYNSTVNIDGVYKKSGFGLTTNYTSGSGTEVDPYVSEFWIDASRLKFTNSNKTGGTAPFIIDATGVQPQVTFNGKVTFGSGQTGTIDEAIAAVVETVAVGDKNINITDNLIPITSLVADTDNSGYQFVGTPTKSNSSGIDTYAEAQIVLDSGDEVYSPYVDDVNVSYYYRFGIKGITNGSVFKIVTINGSNVATSNTITITMNSGQSITAGNWYIIEGLINPTGGDSSAVGSIRNSTGTKIGTVNSFVLPSGTAKLVLGWVANCTISRIKLCKITADTVTSDLTTVNGQISTLQTNINNISWSSLQGKDLMAQQLGYNNYSELAAATTNGKTVINGGYLNTGLINVGGINANQINTVGLIAENINASEIVGKTITGGVINGARINGAVIKASYLDLNGDLEVLTNYIITVAMYNANPSLYTDAVYITADNQFRIPTVSIVRETTTSTNFSYNGAKYSSLIRSYNCGNSGHNVKAVKILPTVVVTNDVVLCNVYNCKLLGSESYWDFRSATVTVNVGSGVNGVSFSIGRRSYSSSDDGSSWGDESVKLYKDNVQIASIQDSWASYGNPLVFPGHSGHLFSINGVSFKAVITSFNSFNIILLSGSYTLQSNFDNTASSLFSVTTTIGSVDPYYAGYPDPVVICNMDSGVYINNMV